MDDSSTDNNMPTVDNDLLTRFLAGNDIDCPRCGYNLRGLRTPQCPECGDALQLQVGLIDPRWGSFILLLASLCLGFGGSSLMGLIALKEAPGRWWVSVSGIALIIQGLWTGLTLPAAIGMKRAFRRLAPRTQWTLASCALALVLIGSIVIVLFFDD